MANYNVDIAIALKNSNKLVQLRKELKAATDNIREFNKEAGKQNKVAVSTFSKLNKQLSRANSLLDKAAIGTSSFTRAAKALVNVEKERNLQLKQREKLLDDLRGVTEKKAAADNKRLQDSLLKLERQSTKEQEQQFLFRQQGEDQLKQKVREINKQRKEENKLIKQNVQQTKKTVAEEIKKKFSIIAAGTERRKNLRQSVRELEANRKQIPINDRINAQLKKRGLILSSNGKQIIRNNQNRNRRGLGGDLPNAIGSGIIGGGFPLLFGQGATAALGGGIGGVAGGLIGGQFGFALSIAGTTIGSTLDQLSKALVKPSENIEMLVNRLGLAGTETGDLALRLEKLGLESDAAELLLKEFEHTFGLTADEFKENAETLKNFNNEINKLGTSLTLMMANVLNPLIKELNNLIAGKKPEGISRGITGTVDFFTANALDLDKRGQLLDEIAPILNPTKPPKLSNIPPGEQTVNNPDFGKPGFVTLPPVKDPLKPFKDKANQKFQREEILPLEQALELEKDRLNISSEQFRLKQEQFKLDNLNADLKLLQGELGENNSEKIKRQIKGLEAQRDLQKQVVQNAEKLINLEDKKDLKLFLKENAKEMRSLEDEDQKNYDDAIKKMDKLKESANASTKNLEDQNKLNEIKLTGSEYEIFLFERKLGLSKEQLAYFDEERIKIAYNNKLRIDGLTKQKQITGDIKNLLATEMSTAIKGLITGANTLNDAFRSILNKMADALLNIGLFGNVAGTLTGGGGLLGKLFSGFLANGGSAKAGKSYIVGEKGPELFTPGTTGTVTPNHALGGSTNVVVNVDASGSSVEGDVQQSEQLGRAISDAIQSELVKQQRPGGLLYR